MNVTHAEIAGEGSRGPWQRETGYINREMLAKYIDDLAAPIYYSAGPGLVAAMQERLRAAGISEDDVVTEEVSGY